MRETLIVDVKDLENPRNNENESLLHILCPCTKSAPVVLDRPFSYHFQSSYLYLTGFLKLYFNLMPVFNKKDLPNFFNHFLEMALKTNWLNW